jgi:periplasmic protein CpxP/Spy
MKSLTHPIASFVPGKRSFALVALMSATMLAAPLLTARADPANNPGVIMVQGTPATQAGAAATATKGETVEQRIATLHTALKITRDQDAKWNAVAQAMRENASAMDKLVAETRTKAPQSMSAVDDLNLYQKFSQAHVDGLKNLISSFSSLYEAMPDAQKKIADTVFTAAHDNATARS